MKKCPRCEHDVKDDDKICPHCGLDLQGRYRPIKKKKGPMTSLIYLVIFFACMSIPMLYSYLLNSIGNDIQQLDKKEVKLEDIIDQEPTAVLAAYTTLADFKNQFTNVDSIVTSIQNYEETLSQKANHVFNKEYSIAVLDNLNIYYTYTYTTDINENLKMTIKRSYDRAHKYNQETITFKKTNVADFEGLFLTDEEKEIVKIYTGEQTVTDQLMNNFLKRKDEFELKKETLGHYGIGNYDGASSFVAHRKGDIYYSELKYSHDVSDYIS